MFKGLWALFTTGLIFNPALLFGALGGILCYVFFDDAQLKILYTNYHLYLLFFVLCATYVYFARPTLKDNLKDTDWNMTSKDIIKHTLLMSFSFLMGMLFASFFDFSDLQIKPDKSDYQYSEIYNVISVQKQAEDMVKNEQKLMETISKSY